MSPPTKCSACGAFTTGIDCEACAAPGPRQCPECARPFALPDRFCSGCGHSLKYTNFSNRTILRFPRSMPLAAFQYPPDRDALRMLSHAGPLKVLARFLQEHWSDAILFGTFQGSAVQVTAKQFPRIRQIADTCQRILGLPPTDVFIRHDTGLGASAFGSEKACGIVLTSGLVENLNERELLFVIGREMGHIRAEHMFYLNMIRLVTDSKIIQSVPFVSEVLRAFVILFLLPWQRKSQITADRAGLLCCQNRVTAIKALIKMALGAKSLYDKVDIEEFLGQAEEVATRRFSVKNMGEYLSGSPFVTNRVKEMEAFCFSQSYHDIMVHSLHPYLPGFACPSCKAMAYPDNLEEGLMRLSCKACGAAVPVQKLPCPQCGTDVDAGDVGMRDRLCMACEKPFVSTSLRELMPEPGQFYRLLGIPASATRPEIELAFVRVSRHATHLHHKLPAYRAYRNLVDPALRKAYDEKVAYLATLGPRRSRTVLRCKDCESPVPAEFCGWCGAKKPEPEPPKAKALTGKTPEPPAAATGDSPPSEQATGPIN